MSLKEIFDANPKILYALARRIYRVLGVANTNIANVFSLGSGIFYEAPDSKRYFIITYHQFKNIKDCKVYALSNEIYNEKVNNKIRGIGLLDSENALHLEEAIIMEDLDIVLFALDNTKNPESVYWSKECFWYLETQPSELIRNTTEILFGGYPVENNGKHLYETPYIVSRNCTLHSSRIWKFDLDKLEIDLTKLSSGGPIDLLVNGISGGPIFNFSLNNDGSCEIALLGISTHITNDPPILFGTTFFEILKKLGHSNYSIYETDKADHI